MQGGLSAAAAAEDVEDGLCGLVRVLATVTVGVLRSVVVVLLVVVVDVVVVVGLAVVVTGTIVSMFLSSCWNVVHLLHHLFKIGHMSDYTFTSQGFDQI